MDYALYKLDVVGVVMAHLKYLSLDIFLRYFDHLTFYCTIQETNKKVLEAVQTLDTSFSTSVTERISWVDVSYNSKTSCVLHVIINYAVIIFASYIA
jgi:hypothetical protein